MLCSANESRYLFCAYLFDSDQNLSMHYNDAWKCKTLTWRKRGNLSDRYVHNINSVNDKISNSTEEKTSITMSISKLDGGTTESHGETRQQHLHLQLHNGRLRNGKRVGANGSLHHLRNGGDFGFLGRIPEKRRGVWTGHPLTKHICAAQSVHKRGTHTTRLAQVTRIAVSSLCAWKESSHLVSHMSHPLLLSHLPITSSSSSSSVTLPSTTTQEHAAQPVQHGHLQEHPAHHGASPSSPSRQAAPTRITLAWKPAEWRKPAHDSSHRNNIFLVLWHGRSREEMCGKTLRTCKENDSTMKQKSQHHAWMSINLKKKEWVSRRNFCSLLTNCSEMSVFSSCWETWHFVVCEQVCACFHKMDKILWQTLGSFDLLHSSHKWISAMWSCVKTQHNNADLDYFKTLILQETLKTQNQPQEEFCPFSEVTRLCQEVGCARNRLQFHTVLQKLKSFLSMQVYAWTVFPLSLGFGGWSLSFRTEQNWWIEERATGKTVCRCQAKHAQPHPNQEHKRHSNKHWSHPIKYNAFWPQRYVVCLWQRGSNQDDYQKSKSHNEACFTDPQSCPGLVVWQDSFGPQDPNPFWHQTSTRRHVDQRKFHTWWVEQSSSFVQYQPFQLHLLHQEFQLDKLLHNGDEEFKIKKKKELCPSRDQQWWICHFLLRQVLLPHQVRLHLKVLGSRQLRENPTAGWVLSQTHSTQRRLLKCDERMHTLAGWWKCSGETRRIEKKKIQKTPTILRLTPGTTKWNLLPRKAKLWGTPLHTEPVLQLTKKIKRIRKRRGTTISTYHGTHRTIWKPSSSWSGRSMENHLAILWKIWLWTWLFGECSWIPLFEQQFISEKTVTLIWDL